MKILVIANDPASLIGFRKPLLIALTKKGLEVHVAAPGLFSTGFEAKELEKWQISVHNIDMKRTGLNPFFDLKTILQLYSLMKNIQPNIILGYTIKPVIYGTIAGWLAKVPNRYVLINGLGYIFQDYGSSNKRKVLRVIVENMYRFTLRKTTGVFFQNPDDEELFRSNKILTQKTPSFVVDGSGVNLDEYPMTAIDKVDFLFVGRLLEEKGVQEYITAATILKEKYPNVEFNIAGSLDLNPSSITKDELSEWVNKRIINYLGQLQDVRPSIARTAVFVLPSYYREGIPRSILEAMSMGRAIITTDSPGCRETTVDGINGFLVPPRNSVILAKAMEKFILNPSLAIDMGKASRKIAEERFDVNRVNSQMLKGMGLE